MAEAFPTQTSSRESIPHQRTSRVHTVPWKSLGLWKSSCRNHRKVGLSDR